MFKLSAPGIIQPALGWIPAVGLNFCGFRWAFVLGRGHKFTGGEKKASLNYLNPTINQAASGTWLSSGPGRGWDNSPLWIIQGNLLNCSGFVQDRMFKTKKDAQILAKTQHLTSDRETHRRLEPLRRWRHFSGAPEPRWHLQETLNPSGHLLRSEVTTSMPRNDTCFS